MAVKRIIIHAISRFGYLLISNEHWQQYQRRAHQAEAALSAIQSAWQNHFTECKTQLASCTREKHDLSIRVSRADSIVGAFERAQKLLQDEIEAARAQVARADTSGRIRELEAENRRLIRRVSDLEAYLKETRGEKMPYL